MPAAGERDGALDGRALLAGDVLRVGEPQRTELALCEMDLAAGRVERDGHEAVVVDVGDVAEAAVLDPWLADWVVLGGEDDAVVLAQAVGLLGVRDLVFAEFAAFAAEVLGAGVEPVDLLVACVAEDHQFAGVVAVQMLGPALDCGFGGLFAGVVLVELSAGLVVRHRVCGVAVAERGPGFALGVVVGAVDAFRVGGGGDVDEALRTCRRRRSRERKKKKKKKKKKKRSWCGGRFELGGGGDVDERSNMPPAPIEGSCAGSPIVTAFAPLSWIRRVKRSSRRRVAHPGLVVEDGRVVVDADAAVSGAGEQRVDSHRVSL